MKHKVEIGSGVCVDIAILIKTRLLIQANSGGGKSWLIRRLAEQFFGIVPVLIIDPEGEFATLREKFGYVLVGKGGETPADPRSAKLVAHKLLELQASAVCDLYEMNPKVRHQWVKLFLEALVDAPKNLWRPTIVFVDEAHTFCPEKGQGESDASEAMTALSSRGRKRRFCAIWATQRLAKLSKSATAELLNRLVGPTFEDVDLKRAADLLSINPEDRREWQKEMRVLEPGKFYAIGRAIATERVLLKVGAVQTTHEDESSTPGLGPPPTPDKIKKLLPKLADLPKEAEEKQRTEVELRSEIRSLKQQLAAVPKVGQQKPNTANVAELKQLRRALDISMKFIVEITTRNFEAAPAEDLKKALESAVATALKSLESKFDRRQAQFDELKGRAAKLLAQMKSLVSEDVAVKLDVRHNEPYSVTPALPITRVARVPSVPRVTNGDSSELSGGRRALLVAAAQHHPEGVTDEQIAVLTGYKKTSRNTFRQQLISSGLLAPGGMGFVATEEGIKALGDSYQPLPTGPELREYWSQRLTGGESVIFNICVERYPQEISKDQIGELANYKKTSINTYCQKLVSRRLLVAGRSGIKANDNLF